MPSIFTELWSRLVGKGPAEGREEPLAEPTEYKGYRIRPAPYPAKGQYQTAGVIEKDFPGGMKEHRFVRAETHVSKDDAATFAIAKAKQIIDEQGDRIFPDF
ncbi:HlyU family transcriptional regulator [Microvirga sp. 2TAF3]|uniref:HlyU family transcriptional regulator n=1 Tax=Microvirga sp. 2TAF3 TaxID=3233014 RepID=UPI003F97F43B